MSLSYLQARSTQLDRPKRGVKRLLEDQDLGHVADLLRNAVAPAGTGPTWRGGGAAFAGAR